MSIVHFRYLRQDAERILSQVDHATKGQINMQQIKNFYFEVGRIVGRVEERIKDLVKYSPKRKDYVDLLEQLEKRCDKLSGLLDRYGCKQEETQHTNRTRRSLYIKQSNNKLVNNKGKIKE